MANEEDLVCAYRLNGTGEGQEIGWEEVRQWSPGSGLIWIHLDHTRPASRKWLKEESGIDRIVCEALLADETRPRCATVQEGLLVIFRGVNLNPGADPEDMISIRLWIDSQRIVSLRHRPLMAVRDLREAIRLGKGPKDTGAFLVDIADRLVNRMNTVVEEIEDTVDDLENQLLTSESYEIRPKLASIRRQAIGLRRYLAPQREVMAGLQNERMP
jgi:zinc transporter